jgi:hypothetical protein
MITPYDRLQKWFSMITNTIDKRVNVVTAKQILAADLGNWGWMPAISLVSACGLVGIAVADTRSLQLSNWADPLFWMGLVTTILPSAIRLLSRDASRRERIALVVLLGLMLYLIKVMHSPYGFNFSDEYVHEYNVTQILEKGVLFSPNPIIAVTPFYPGLAIVTSALASLSGLSVFVSGLIVIGLARLILMLALYLFYELVGGSARIAGIAVMLYAGNANFLYWSAQFSYESLALPLALLILFVIAKRDASRDASERKSYTFVAVLGISVLIIFHHLSAFFLTVFLVIWAFLVFRSPLTILNWLKANLEGTESNLQLSDNPDDPEAKETDFIHSSGPSWLAILAIVLTSAWLVYVASNTFTYLFAAFRAAFLSIVGVVGGTEAPRALFQSNTGVAAAVWQRVMGLGSVALLAAGVPFGVLAFWQRYQKKRLVWILILMGLAYFAMLGLRFAPKAWETGNRSSEFLFIGLAFLVSIGGLDVWRSKSLFLIGNTVYVIGMCVILVGGVIAGWPAELVRQQPSLLKVGGVLIEPQGVTAAKWFLTQFGPANRLGAVPSDARMFLTYGNQFAYEGHYPNVSEILETPDFPNWQKEVLQNFSIRFLVMDRRMISRNNMAGYFFDQSDGGQTLSTELIDREVYDKFNKVETFDRILDGGNITVYDLLRLLESKP